MEPADAGDKGLDLGHGCYWRDLLDAAARVLALAVVRHLVEARVKVGVVRALSAVDNVSTPVPRVDQVVTRAPVDSVSARPLGEDLAAIGTATVLYGVYLVIAAATDQEVVAPVAE